MSAWITDRVPTREDGDCMTMVWVSSPREVYRCDYSVIKLGTPWQPITYPEPYVKPKKWAVYESFKKDSVFLAKDGKHVIGLSPFTYEEITAMTDALNKLEDSHD